MQIANIKIQGSLPEHATSALAEADRLMTVCNACRYCEGICAVFPAMEMRRSFTDGDLNYIANLCHGCGACYDDCQFSPPHEFQVNMPKALAIVRSESYEAYAWPGFLSGLFRRNGLAVTLVAAFSVAGFIAGFIALNDPGALFQISAGPGSFYKLMPHDSMAALFGAVFLYAVIGLAMGVRNLWTSAAGPEIGLDIAALWQAMKDAGRLRYLDGGGSGCVTDSARPKDRRRIYHHLTFYGFGLCFAATSVATLYHYLLGLQAPYPWYDLPVLLGTAGGIGLLVGPAGLLAEKWRRDPALQDQARFGMEAAFLAMLFLTSLTGLALLVLRDTAAMGLLLALHLGIVCALFITMPYGKFVHGIYRFTALVRYALESRALNTNAN
ncbi:tricarballylate utilization 4Fe-4S protein TcuB [Ferrovibrio sp.]|uniref:tricarballylate utilization 4Fe-4S protein TcuB n=1 Tax=Ferrovibrio sp. TaxID=1917215 RepID=UPI0035B37E16